MDTRVAAGVGVLLAVAILGIVWIVSPVAAGRVDSGRVRREATADVETADPIKVSAESPQGEKVPATRRIVSAETPTLQPVGVSRSSRPQATSVPVPTPADQSDTDRVQSSLNAMQASIDRYDGAGQDEQGRIRQEFRGLLKSSDPAVRAQALDSLAGWGDASAPEAVREWLADENTSRAAVPAAIRCAAQLGMTDLSAGIRKFLRDSDEMTRITAITALAQMGDSESVAAFEEAAADSNYRIARAGRRALESVRKRSPAP